jgi:hypothetical protein
VTLRLELRLLTLSSPSITAQKRQKLGTERRAADGQNAKAAVSQDSFLDILRRGTAAAGNGAGGTRSGESGSSAAPSYLRDNYLVESKKRAKDYVLEEDADEDVEVRSFAW